jgi:thioredoxin 1
MESVHELAPGENFDEFLKKAGMPVIVDFHAEWCGPCKRLGPEIEKRQQTSGKFVVLKINVDNHGDLADKFEVSGIPHVILFKDCKPVSIFTGFNLAELDKMIESL